MPETSARTRCRHCRARDSKPNRDFCDHCYRLGVARDRGRGNANGVLIAVRPEDEQLEDTGLRIDDGDQARKYGARGDEALAYNAEPALLYPDGTRVVPVPKNIVIRFWIEPDPNKPNLLRVLRMRANKKGQP